MKQSDILMIVVVAIIAGAGSLLISGFLFSPSDARQLKAQKVDAINSSFSQPDKRFFNEQSINPTQLIQIGDTNNTQPF